MNFAVSIAILIFSIIMYNFALTVSDPLSAIFPGATLVIMGALSLILLFQEVDIFIKWTKYNKEAAIASSKKRGEYPFLRIITAMALILAYFPLLNTFGFYFSSFLFFLTFTLIFCTDKKAFCQRMHIQIAFPAIFVAILYSLFNLLLKVSLPRGILF